MIVCWSIWILIGIVGESSAATALQHKPTAIAKGAKASLVVTFSWLVDFMVVPLSEVEERESVCPCPFLMGRNYSDTTNQLATYIA
jgi:hypothetical protein